MEWVPTYEQIDAWLLALNMPPASITGLTITALALFSVHVTNIAKSYMGQPRRGTTAHTRWQAAWRAVVVCLAILLGVITSALGAHTPIQGAVLGAAAGALAPFIFAVTKRLTRRPSIPDEVDRTN